MVSSNHLLDAALLSASPTPCVTAPDWLAEAIVVATWWRQHGLFAAINDVLRVPRGRAGAYEPCDFVLFLLAFSVSRMGKVSHFRRRLGQHALALAAAWDRDAVPSASALSRFLAVVDESALAQLRALLFNALLTEGVDAPDLGAVIDRQGERHVVFDADGTRKATRVRRLVADAQRPPARRRHRSSYAPGYRGRKRGEAVRSRTVAQQAHTKEWLGTRAAAGNGDLWGDLAWVATQVAAYLDARGIPRSRGIVRLDGGYGYVRTVAILADQGLGYLMRSGDYRLLRHPVVRQRLAQTPAVELLLHGEATPRQVVDLGEIEWRAGGRSKQVVRTRVVLTIRQPLPEEGQGAKIGKRIGERIYELFVTDRPAAALTAVDVVSLYFGRGDHECTLWAEDVEANADRLVSTDGVGQAFFQEICQATWNTRLWLGRAQTPQMTRRTTWSPASGEEAPGMPPAESAQTVGDDVQEKEAAGPAALQEQEERAQVVRGERTATEGTATEEAIQSVEGVSEVEWEVQVVAGRGPATEKFSGSDFEVVDVDRLRCPAGKELQAVDRQRTAEGERVTYRARRRDCRHCPLAAQCRGTGASDRTGRSVTARMRRRETMPEPAAVGLGAALPPVGPLPVIWEDLPAAVLRNRVHLLLEGQNVEVTETVAPARSLPDNVIELNRDRRAHRRLTYAERLDRNGLEPRGCRRHVHISGVPPWLQQLLGFAAA
jgi:hypothetical protein